MHFIVNCPIEKLEEDSADTIRGATEVKGASRSCGGSLKIVHAKENDLGNPKDITLGGKREEYQNVKRGFPVLKKNIVLHVEAYGCVCWEIYDNPRFAGNKEEITPGDRQYVKFTPASIKKVECKSSYDEYDYGHDDYKY